MKNRRTSIPVPAEISSILESGLAPLDLSWVQEIPTLEPESSNKDEVGRDPKINPTNPEIMNVGGDMSELIQSCDQVPYSRTLSKHEPENNHTHSGHQPMPDIVTTSISKIYELNQTTLEHIYPSGINSSKPGSADVDGGRGFNGLKEGLQFREESLDENDEHPVPTASSTESNIQYHGSNRLKNGLILRTESDVGKGTHPVTPIDKSEGFQTFSNPSSKHKKFTTIHDLKRKLTEEEEENSIKCNQSISWETEPKPSCSSREQDGEDWDANNPLTINQQEKIETDIIKDVVLNKNISEKDKINEIKENYEIGCNETCSIITSTTAVRAGEIIKTECSDTENFQVEQVLKYIEELDESVENLKYSHPDKNLWKDNDSYQTSVNKSWTTDKIEHEKAPKILTNDQARNVLFEQTNDDNGMDENVGSVKSRVMRLNNLLERRESREKLTIQDARNQEKTSNENKISNDEFRTVPDENEKHKMEIVKTDAEEMRNEMQNIYSIDELINKEKKVGSENNVQTQDVHQEEEEKVDDEVTIDNPCTPVRIEAKGLRMEGLHECLELISQDKVKFEKEEISFEPTDESQGSENMEIKSFSSYDIIKMGRDKSVLLDGIKCETSSNNEFRQNTGETWEPLPEILLSPKVETNAFNLLTESKKKEESKVCKYNEKSSYESAPVISGPRDNTSTTNPSSHSATHKPNYPKILENKTTPTEGANTGVLIGRTEVEIVPRIGNDEYNSETSSTDWRREGWSDRSEVDDEDTRNLWKPMILNQSLISVIITCILHILLVCSMYILAKPCF